MRAAVPRCRMRYLKSDPTEFVLIGARVIYAHEVLARLI